MHRIELSPRLRTVAELVPDGTRFADVGTDHAYLPAFLLQQDRIRRAVVSDLRRGPLDNARDTANRYELTDRMEFRLCNGLEGIGPEEADTIAIAGMGGETIMEILAAAPWTAKGERMLILQPMSGQPELRQWLQTHGFRIVAERLCREGRTMYTVLAARPGTMEELTAGERWAGRQSPSDDAPLRLEYLEDLQKRAAWAIAGLSKSRRESDSARLKETQEALNDLQRMTKEWKLWQQ